MLRLSWFSFVIILKEYLSPETAFFIIYDWGGLNIKLSYFYLLSFNLPIDLESGNFCCMSLSTLGHRIVLSKLILPSYVDCMNWNTLSLSNSAALGRSLILVFRQFLMRSDNLLE